MTADDVVEEPFETSTTAGSRLFGLVFLASAVVCFAGALMGTTDVVLLRFVGVALGLLFLKGSNTAFATVHIDQSTISYRTVLFTRDVKFADLREVTRRRGLMSEQLVLRPRNGLAIRLSAGAFKDEEGLRKVLSSRLA